MIKESINGYGKVKNTLWLMTQPIDLRADYLWDQTEDKGRELITTIATPHLNHEVLSCRSLFVQLGEKIKDLHPSTVINLATENYSILFRLHFPNTPVVRFPISRVRDTESITTKGYYIGLQDQELAKFKTSLDISNPLVFDDAGHTGGTQRMALEMLNIDPAQATHAFLLANNGKPYGKPAIIPWLDSIGATHYEARTFTSPEDKLWHVEDMHGGKRLSWHDQVNPILSTQSKFVPFLNPDINQEKTALLLADLQTMNEEGKR